MPQQRILVVDDQCDIADSLVRLLITLGYDARAVYDGAQAADQAIAFLPDVAFIDIGMPRFDGLQTVAKIRGCRQGAHVILVALTGWTSPDSRSRALAAGFDLFVVKPMNLDKLREVLALLDPDASPLSRAGRIYRLATAWAQSKGA